MSNYKLLKDNDVAKHYNVDDHTFFYRKDTGFSCRLGTKGDWPAEPFADDFDIHRAMGMSKVLDGLGMSCPDPFWNSEGPELLDIEITERCNRHCPYCYQSATADGQDMPLELYRKILFQTHRTVTQVALGGGETTLHKEFCEILRMTREDFGIVPNYTTNGDWIVDRELYDDDMAQEILEATRKYCGAIAVSAHGEQEEWEPKAIVLAQEGIKTNIHYILSEGSIEGATKLLLDGTLHKSINAVIFLLHKPVGRGSDKDVLRSRSKIREFLDAIKEAKFKVGFDACCAPMIVSMTDIDTVSFDHCEGARFSGYIHVDGQVKGCSFDKAKTAKIQDEGFDKIWKKDLQEYRNHFLSCECKCDKKAECRGGCPFAPEIVLCDKEGKVNQSSIYATREKTKC